jgi:AraC-like DNA-binding protein
MESDASEKQPWTASSLAQAAGVASSYVARLCREGEIAAQKFGQAWMIPYEEGMRWMAERAGHSTEEGTDSTLTDED